ncbi:MAG: hypothetical protein OEW11_03630 [Nitrospirota bacterium]|nr:hypothetical protein [Nitrospirota bacterium]
MARKRSIKKSTRDFGTHADKVAAFIKARTEGATDEHVSLLYDYAVIHLYRGFESLMFDALVGSINNDTATVSDRKGIKFPKHLSKAVCEYLVTSGRFFDFKGRDGLIKVLKEFVPDKHFLLEEVKKKKYRSALEQLSALRNFAAHNSAQSRKAALVATGQKRLHSAGAWLKRGKRFNTLVDTLKDLASQIEKQARW